MSKLLKLYPAFLIGYSLLPLMVRAEKLDNIVTNAGTTLKTIISALFVLATVVFLWGVVQFISSAEDETKRNKAKGVMTWGIIGLAVMAAAWGVTTVLVNYFGAQQGVLPERPGQIQ